MSLKVGELEAELSVNDKPFDRGLNQADGKFNRFAKKIASDAEKAGDKAGSGMGGKLKDGVGKALSNMKGLPALAAGSAIGLALVAGITGAMDIESANAKLAAGLGFTQVQSAKAGKIAGDLYKNAYGDSVADIDDTLKVVFQSGIVSINDSKDAIADVAAEVENFSAISEEEALPITRAVAQMLKTGLAKNATEAFDILTRGQQLGINKSEDLLDTFNEYGTQFRKLGLDGTAALGLINQLLQGGARDSDLAADAIKEFSIRAIDGSKTTVDAFKSLHLNVDQTTAAFAKGGPAAKQAFGAILDQLNSIKDPVERNRIGVELFGTQWEDLGAAIRKADLDTAAGSLGQVAGAAKAAGDTLNDTTMSGLTTVGRTIKMTIIDAIGKYALPKLKEFAAWFNGPGKFLLVSWALEAGSAILGLSENMLGALGGMIGGLAKFGRVAMIAAAGAVAAFNPGLAVTMLQNADALGQWAEEAKTGIGDARTELQRWKEGVDKTNLKVKLQADIADLEAKLKTAKAQLADKSLTKERRAEIVATIKDLQSKLTTAHTALDAKWITKQRIARLEATKKDLDTKIAAAKRALASKDLTRERAAKLNADIRALLAKKTQAQRAIDALHGKTVSVEIKYTSGGVNLTTPSSVGRKALGGPIHGPGGPTDDRAGLYALSDDEHVVTAKEVHGAGGHGAVEAMRRHWAKGLATGGRAGGATFQSTYDAAAKRGAQRYASSFGSYGGAMAFASSQAGKNYGWGSSGPRTYDCSGFMSAITNYIRGKYPYSRVGSTGTFPWSGFARGAGAFMIGSRRGNPGHMAGTLMGMNVESRGGDGVVVGSRARGANNSLFGGNVWHLARLAMGGRAGDAPFDLFNPQGRHFDRKLRGLLGYERGTPYVLRDGLAYLHQGERVITADANSGKESSNPMTVALSKEDRDMQRELLQLLRRLGDRPIHLDGRRVDEAMSGIAIGRGY